MLRIAKYLLPLVLFPATCLAWTPLPTSTDDTMATDQNFLEVYRKMNSLQYDLDNVSVSSSIGRSSSTVIPGDVVISNTGYGVCISSVQVTTYGNRVFIYANLIGYHNTQFDQVYAKILQDGTPLVPDRVFASGVQFIVYKRIPFSISYVTETTPSAGTHTYCLAPRVSEGTFTFDGVTTGNSWGVKEW